jgi:tetratricopeptide (TPR) repeat protein
MLNLNKISFITLGKKQIISVLFIAFSYSIFAQNSFYDNSDLFYKKVEELVYLSQYDNAIRIIDNLSLTNTFFSCEDKNNLKGKVYTRQFQKTKNPCYSDSSIYYFSKALTCAQKLSKDVHLQLKYISNFNHNKAADALNTQKIDSAEFYYSQSRKALLLVDSSLVYKRDIEFYLAIASVSNSLFEKDMNDKSYFEKSINYFDKVLKLDSTNYGATYNTMILYYNVAVTELKKANYCKQVEIANSVDWSNPNQEIPSIEKLLECIKPEEFEKYNFTPAIKKALPFALKAYQMDPSRKHVLQALIGIYFSVNDKKAVSKYKNELKKLNQ